MYLRGISAEYYSYSGDLVPVSWEDRLHLLREMGDDPADEHAIDAAVFRLDAKPWLSWLQSRHIISQGTSEYVDIRVSPDQLDQPFEWKITTEQGQTIKGDFVPSMLEEVGDYHIDAVRYSARRLVMTDLPPGYHQFSVECNHQIQQALLIVAPASCYSGMDLNTRIWGINCQLYTLRSERNWGIGDFTDLTELIELGAAAGMDLISLNPMHAPLTIEMDIASPYSPSDRCFLNPLYLDPEAVQEFAEISDSNQVSLPDIQHQLSDLRKSELIDYDAVARLKYSVYDDMFQYFIEHHISVNSERASEFNHYVQRQGQALAEFSNFESRNFGLNLRHAADPQFHQYLQWLTDRQFAACQQFAKKAGMRIGLMKDLAVGAVGRGAEVQGNPELYCKNATVGAPPDPLAEQGQNWDLPALNPTALKASNYQHFTDLLRANMHSCGGLRIDHILGLLRLWWCLPNIEGGAYVYYPLEDLLAILCLESHRQRCLVVGEDMGTVPNELREAMASKHIYSNKLFYFEKQHDQNFKLPQSHQQDALLMVTNHDVPTLAGWWDGADLAIRKQIGLAVSDQEHSDACRDRRQNRQALLNWLQLQQLLPENWQAESLDKAFDFQLCSAILIANARSRSQMMLFQLDDLQLLHDPVNIPGTWKQYPNWRRKQKTSTKELFNDPAIRSLLCCIHQERMQ